MVTIELSSEYGYVLASAISTFFVGTFLGGRVGVFRKAAKVPYPYEYASYEQIQSAPPAKAAAMHQFNCAQRGHQNFNENHLTALAAMLIAGLKYPLISAGMGALWSVNRVLYATGYTNGKEGGRGRYQGILWMVAQYVMVGYAGKVAYDIATS